MKQDIFKQLENIAKRDIADPKWIASNREVLLSYIKAHPAAPVHARQPIASHGAHSGFSRFFMPRMVPAFIVALIMLVSATGVTIASQDSLPGDTLYSWKVGVENVESMFIVSAMSCAQFEVGRATKRLHEVTELRFVTRPIPKPRKPPTLAYKNRSRSLRGNRQGGLRKRRPSSSSGRRAQCDPASSQDAVLDQLAPKVDDQIKPNIQDAITVINNTSTTLDSALADLKAHAREDLGTAKAQESIKEDATLKLQTTKEKIDAIWGIVVVR